MSPHIAISATFECGNIQLLKKSVHADAGTASVVVRIRPDTFSELEQCCHCQYFCFRSTVSGLPETADGSCKPLQVHYAIANAASEASFPQAWPGTWVCFTEAMHDTEAWQRQTDTKYEDGQLSWTHSHSKNGSVYFTFYPLFTYQRHLELISKCSLYADVTSLGQSLQGREIDLVTVGTGERVCWVFHRQHPGESMASWYAEGFLTRLLGLDRNGEVDGLVYRLLQMYTFYIVPMMCPDGVVMGHIRVNSVGANLNREWAPRGTKDDPDFYEAPTLQRSPEVWYVLNKMDETGVDIALDIHGDEELPYNFIAGGNGVSNWSKRLESLLGAFLGSYCRANPDMQKETGYAPDPPGEADMGCALNALTERFDCLAMTLEMPFKDCRSDPDPVHGWSPHRSYMLGASLVDPLAYIHPYLRDEGDFWTKLPADDAYVVPEGPPLTLPTN